MNAHDNTTIRACWRKAYHLARQCEHNFHRRHNLATIITLMTPETARLYVQALQAVAARHSHTNTLMTRPLPHSIDAEWLINTRCNRYAALSGRVPG